jgi:hypothetical protein
MTPSIAPTGPDTPQATPIPWWRVPMVWVVLSGPASVVVASLATAVIAWKHIDPVIAVTPSGALRAGDDVSAPTRSHDALAPALKARNHAASPHQ